MALNNAPKYRSHIFFLFISGIIVLIISALVYLLILKSVYGRFGTAQLIPGVSSLEDLIFGSSPKVALLSSEYTLNMLPDESGWQKENLNTWKKFFNNADVKYYVISDYDIESGNHFVYDLIVLPGAKSLSDKEIVNIKKFLENGGSVFATSGTASYSSDGKWRGWQFLSDVFGIRQTKEIGFSDKTKVHTLRGGLPLTSNIPTGFPLSVASWDRPIAAEVLDPRTTQVSFWYNHKLEDGLIREGIKETAGMVYGNYGKGRFIWMGFEINSVLGVQQDYIVFERLFNNCVNWLSYNPIAFVRDWPNGYKSAAALVTVLSKEEKNLKNLFPLLRDEKIKFTFFVEPSLAEKNITFIKELNSYGEIGALVNLEYTSYKYTTDDKIFNIKKQIQNLRKSRETLESILGKSVSGMQPLSGLHNEITIKAAIKSGFDYFVSDSLTDRTVPKTLVRGDDRISLITKTAKDDLEVIRNFGLTEKEFQFYTYQEDIDRLNFEGGLYLFKIHPECQLADSNVSVLKDVIHELKNKNFWIATLSEIQQWYDKREYLELRTQKRGSTRVVITITNYGASNINDLVIDVDLNEKAERVTIDTEIIGTKPAELNHFEGDQFITLFIEELDEGESRTYYIDYDKVSS